MKLANDDHRAKAANAIGPGTTVFLSRRASSVQVVFCKELLTTLRPDGFNIGLNDGAAAGQTITHAHVHVIPRFNRDVMDPRGGIRWVIAGKAAYWKP